MSEKGELAQYFERNYLKWQMENGRGTIEEYSRLLEVSKSYLSQLMNGTNTGVSYKVAQRVATVTGDPSILSILGYERPSTPFDHLPEPFRARWILATHEINELLEARGLTGDEPEVLALVAAVLEKYGFRNRE